MRKLTLPQLEQRIQGHDGQIQVIFKAIQELIKAPEKPKKKIGFEVKEAKAKYGKDRNGESEKQIEGRITAERERG